MSTTMHFWVTVVVSLLEALPLVLVAVAWSYSHRHGTFNNPVARITMLFCVLAIILYLFYR
jgi:hypothetical protein